MYKVSVLRALNALRDALVRLGGNPHRIDLPRPPGVLKVGVDDFLLANGKKARKAFDGLEHVPLFLGQGISGVDLLEKEFEPIRWIVPGLIPQGLTIFVGKPKAGKSWFVLELVVAISSGQKMEGLALPETGDVLYLALEDPEYRLQERLKKIGASFKGKYSAHFFCEWNRVEKDGLIALERWLAQHPNCKAVFIDTFALMREAPKSKNSYYEDYEAARALKNIADKFNIAVVAVHHTRKQESDDPFDLISGTNGISGAADTNIILIRERESMDAVLHVTGRAVAEQALALQFNDCVWKVLGQASTIQATKTQEEILFAMIEAGEPMGVSEIAEATGRKVGSLPKTIRRMLRNGLIQKVGGRKYTPVSEKTKIAKFQK